VARDYVEFPSQLLEHWLSTPEILNRYAVHYQTGKPIPQSLVDKIKQASRFNKGFDTVEYLSSALIDMKLHLAGAQAIDPDRFERETLAALDMPAEIVMRHRTPQFNNDNVFSVGNTVDPADAYRAFRGRDAGVDALMRKRGFPVPTP
jgi:peptidyl-dipeptidase Dcp